MKWQYATLCPRCPKFDLQNNPATRGGEVFSREGLKTWIGQVKNDCEPKVKLAGHGTPWYYLMGAAGPRGGGSLGHSVHNWPSITVLADGSCTYKTQLFVQIGFISAIFGFPSVSNQWGSRRLSSSKSFSIVTVVASCVNVRFGELVVRKRDLTDLLVAFVYDWFGKIVFDHHHEVAISGLYFSALISFYYILGFSAPWLGRGKIFIKVSQNLTFYRRKICNSQVFIRRTSLARQYDFRVEKRKMHTQKSWGRLNELWNNFASSVSLYHRK